MALDVLYRPGRNNLSFVQCSLFHLLILSFPMRKYIRIPMMLLHCSEQWREAIVAAVIVVVIALGAIVPAKFSGQIV